MRSIVTLLVTVILVAVLLLSACTSVQTTWQRFQRTSSDYYTPVSLVELIANPEKHVGWRVEVTGYLDCQFEGDKLFLTREDYEHRTTANSIHVACFHSEIGFGKAERQRWQGSRVTVAGTFDGMSRTKHEDDGEGLLDVYIGPDNTGSISPIDWLGIDE